MRADAWSDDEIILAVATCPREKQSYSPRHKNVIELADLLGRSRGAVSLHFANISHLIHGGDHGKTHVGRRTREIFDEYKGRDEELQAKASEIRRRLLQIDLTPRAEREVPEDEARKLIQEIIDEARKAGLPDEAVVTYERKGSWYVGALMPLDSVILRFEAPGTLFARALLVILDQNGIRSRGLDLAARGEWQELVDEQLKIDAPLLHQEELSPKDRTTLLIRLRQLGSLRFWSLEHGLDRFISDTDRDALRTEIASRLDIDASKLCDECLLMLKDLTEEGDEPVQPEEAQNASRES